VICILRGDPRGQGKLTTSPQVEWWKKAEGSGFPSLDLGLQFKGRKRKKWQGMNYVQKGVIYEVFLLCF
jgi:hypothetical protein